jgi:hypothetical protein
MNTPFDWTCPHCGAHSTVQSQNSQSSFVDIILGTALHEEGVKLSWTAVKCPSPKCGKFTFDVAAKFGVLGSDGAYSRRKVKVNEASLPVGLGTVRFLPRVQKPLSIHVPESIKEDYVEACMIKDLSPKAAATLCRRALQGMIRNFWTVKAPTLHKELQLIEEKCDPDLYKALMGLKSIGNIGAHPTMDINIDVDEGEVDALIHVLQILDEDWYVAKAEKAKRIATMNQISANKVVSKNSNEAA